MSPSELAPGLTRSQTLLTALALVLAVLWVYAPVRGHEWVRYDDEVYVFENAQVARGLDAEGVAWAFQSRHAGNYHPLTWLAHQLDVQLFGLDPGPHHLVNVALHALNAVLAFLLLAAWLGSGWAGALGAAVFALHPLRVESVAWIAERKDVLCATFLLVALLLYLRHGRAPSAGRYAACLLALALALLAKPMAVTFPALALCLDLAPLGRARSVPWRRLVLEKLPFAALALAGAAATLWAQSAAGATSSLAGLALELRLANALRTLWVYVQQSLWPSGLMVFYPHAAALAEAPLRALLPGAAAGLALLVAGGLGAWRLRARRPAVLSGLAFCLCALAPVVGIVQVGTQAHADRYTYLPSLGLIAAVGAALALLPRPRLVGALALAGAAALALAARAQVGVWRDTRTLFTHALRVDEGNYLAHAKLGELALEEGDLEGARARFERALALQPRFAHALGKLALCDLAEGELAAARARLLAARALEPDDPELRLNLGVVELERGELAAARAHFEAVRALDPGNAVAHFDLGLLAQRAGEPGPAEEHYRAALALAPGHVEAWSNLGQLQLAAGRLAEAEAALRRAGELAPEDALAHFNLAVVLERRGDAAGAEAAFARAFALDPGLAELRRTLPAPGREE
ncbi:MAG TPA: tetratricopeptide repeat protein [Planctomycetota bacterium]